MVIDVLLRILLHFYACISFVGILGAFWLVFHLLRGNGKAYLARSPKTRFVVRNWKPCIIGYLAVGVAIGPVAWGHVYMLIATLVLWAMLIVFRWVVDSASEDDDDDAPPG